AVAGPTRHDMPLPPLQRPRLRSQDFELIVCEANHSASFRLRWCRVRVQLRALIIAGGLKSPAPPRGQGDQALKPPASHVANRTIGIDDHAIANRSECGEVDPHNAHRIPPPNAAQPRKVPIPSVERMSRWISRAPAAPALPPQARAESP